jgi:hypothetical protein
VRLLLYVEGETEEAALPDFFGRWLIGRVKDPEIKAVNFHGAGGYLREFSKRAKRDLGGRYVHGIIGLIDLYGSRLSFPTGSVGEKTKDSVSISPFMRPKLGSLAGSTCFQSQLTSVFQRRLPKGSTSRTPQEQFCNAYTRHILIATMERSLMGPSCLGSSIRMSPMIAALI